MEMEMVILEALSLEERRNVSATESCETALGKSLSSSSFSILDSILEMAVGRLVSPRLMELEMGEGFIGPVDAKELEMMMVMLKPLDARRHKSKRGRLIGDVETGTEMVHFADVMDLSMPALCEQCGQDST